ncbi:MAG: RsmD family RNA methyltransferase, partial [Deltaproteobacteria bacterium]|nr:RsmD family RNA methyltransferase [Deltaproteobacteria bacterium]
GSLKGRKIPNVFDIKNVSPSSDFLKGVLFNVIGKDIEGGVFCDLYAGTGNVGFEAISRGAAFCIFVETSPELISIIINLSKRFGIEEKVKIIKKDVLRALENGVLNEYKPDYIFIDPPYGSGLCEKTINEITRCSAGKSNIIVQHDKREVLSSEYPTYKLITEKAHGKSVLSFYEALNKTY